MGSYVSEKKGIEIKMGAFLDIPVASRGLPLGFNLESKFGRYSHVVSRGLPLGFHLGANLVGIPTMASHGLPWSPMASRIKKKLNKKCCFGSLAGVIYTSLF